MQDTPDDLEALVADMRGPFLRTSRERVALIARLGSEAAIAREPAPLVARLAREAHTLRGGGAAFGFSSLSEAAAAVEAAGRAFLANDTSLPPDALDRAIDRLQTVSRELSAD